VKGGAAAGPVVLHRAGAPGLERHLLLISYHFPPGGGIGALRWRRMIPLLADAGWSVDVVTALPALGDPTTERIPDLPSTTEVVAVPDLPPVAARVEDAAWRLRRAASEAVRRRPDPDGTHGPRGGGEAAGGRGAAPARPPSVPSDRLGWRLTSPRGGLRLYWTWLERRRARLWARAAADAALKLAARRPVVAAIVSTPPHWTQAAGPRLARQLGVPYVADLRDPWAATRFLPEHVATPAWLHLARAAERASLRAASLVLANTEASAEALRAAHPSEAERIRVVRNGWDTATPAREGDGRFVVAYAGSIYGDRSPVPLFRGAALARTRRGLTPKTFGIELMGAIDRGADWVEGLARAEGVADLVRVHPPASREEARDFMARAAVLVSLPWSQDLSVPAKVYEYLGHEAWPLVLAAPGSAPAVMLQGSGAVVADPQDPEEIAQFLCDRYDRWRDGARPGAVAGRDAFHRSAAVRTLADALQSTVK
jgi:glycosyltransferase involved in cell wall biosynthesis